MKLIKIFLACILAVFLVGFIYLAYVQIESRKVPQRSADFFYEHKSMLEDFVDLCLDNEISFIDKVDREDWDEYRYNISKYYIYGYQELSAQTQQKFEDILDVFIENNVSSINVWTYRDGEMAERRKYSLSITFSWGGSWADLLYTDEFVSDVGELLEYEFEEQAQHLDQEHWVLVYNYNDKRVVTKK